MNLWEKGTERAPACPRTKIFKSTYNNFTILFTVYIIQFFRHWNKPKYTRLKEYILLLVVSCVTINNHDLYARRLFDVYVDIWYRCVETREDSCPSLFCR